MWKCWQSWGREGSFHGVQGQSTEAEVGGCVFASCWEKSMQEMSESTAELEDSGACAPCVSASACGNLKCQVQWIPVAGRATSV